MTRWNSGSRSRDTSVSKPGTLPPRVEPVETQTPPPRVEPVETQTPPPRVEPVETRTSQPWVEPVETRTPPPRVEPVETRIANADALASPTTAVEPPLRANASKGRRSLTSA